MSYLYLLVLVTLVILFVWEMKRSLRRSAVTNELINKYADKPTTAEQHEMISAIYAYCLADWKLKRVVRKYGATEEDFHLLYRKLCRWGDFRKGRRYVPISSFFFVYTLEYLLKHPDADEKEMAKKCMNFFHI